MYASESSLFVVHANSHTIGVYDLDLNQISTIQIEDNAQLITLQSDQTVVYTTTGGYITIIRPERVLILVERMIIFLLVLVESVWTRWIQS